MLLSLQHKKTCGAHDVLISLVFQGPAPDLVAQANVDGCGFRGRMLLSL